MSGVDGWVGIRAHIHACMPRCMLTVCERERVREIHGYLPSTSHTRSSASKLGPESPYMSDGGHRGERHYQTSQLEARAHSVTH